MHHAALVNSQLYVPCLQVDVEKTSKPLPFLAAHIPKYVMYACAFLGTERTFTMNWSLIVL